MVQEGMSFFSVFISIQDISWKKILFFGSSCLLFCVSCITSLVPTKFGHQVSPSKILFITTLAYYKDKYSDILDFLGTNKYIEKLNIKD